MNYIMLLPDLVFLNKHQLLNAVVLTYLSCKGLMNVIWIVQLLSIGTFIKSIKV